MNLREILAERIMELCVAQGITINRLAVLSGLTQSTVDGILKGRSKNPQLATLIRISRGLDMTVSEFLDDPRIRDVQLED